MENLIARALFVALVNHLADADRHCYDVWKHKSIYGEITVGIGRGKENMCLGFWEDLWDKLLVPEIDTIPQCDILSEQEMIDFILSL